MVALEGNAPAVVHVAQQGTCRKQPQSQHTQSAAAAPRHSQLCCLPTAKQLLHGTVSVGRVVVCQQFMPALALKCLQLHSVQRDAVIVPVPVTMRLWPHLVMNGSRKCTLILRSLSAGSCDTGPYVGPDIRANNPPAGWPCPLQASAGAAGRSLVDWPDGQNNELHDW